MGSIIVADIDRGSCDSFVIKSFGSRRGLHQSDPVVVQVCPTISQQMGRGKHNGSSDSELC